jgi:carbamoyltransferase
MKILGISAYFHDSAAALVVDGELVAAAQEERFTRIKHDSALPVSAARFCLQQAGLTMDDVDHVVFYEKPLRKFERIVDNHLRTFPRGLGQFTRAMGTWLGSRLWLKNDLASTLGCRPDQLLFSEHHLSHAASSFLGTDWDDAAIVTVDGVGEHNTTAIFRGKSNEGGTRIQPLLELHFPHSIGLLYSALTAYLGFRVNEGEYKVMGLAPYGTPRFVDAFEQLATIREDASLELDLRYFAFHHHAERSFTPALEQLLGSARVPGSRLALDDDPTSRDPEAQRFADVAASLQAFTERYLLALCRRAHELTGCARLCLAGGVALNSVANRRIAEEGPFDEVFVHPAAGDAGGAAGAALYTSVCVLGDERRGLHTPMLGARHDVDEVEALLRDCRVPHQRFDSDDDLYEEIARRLGYGQVGALVSGRFEWGPRALGARSILADPRGPGVRDRVNAKVKFRESFRPFAPVALPEDAAAWFDLGKKRDRRLWPYMLSVVPAKERARQELPAVVHVDGSARLQVATDAHSPALCGVLRAFKRRTGVGVLLNTSMNLKDEPPVASPAEAYGTFLRSDLDFLVLEGCLLSKQDSGVERRATAHRAAGQRRAA